jgi:hypothetical protein
MANPAREVSSNQVIESVKTGRTLEERFPRKHQSRGDRVLIWWISVGMVMVFLILGLLLIQVLVSGPQNRTPTESAWYCHALPLINILSRDLSGSILAPTCHTAVTPLPYP